MANFIFTSSDNTNTIKSGLSLAYGLCTADAHKITLKSHTVLYFAPCAFMYPFISTFCSLPAG